ncbi:MAG TPA: hypothetical protein VGK22_03905 [Candidatus Angelobacter sp.]
MIKIGKQPSIRFGRLWIALLAIVIAGSWSCGGGGSSTASAGPTPTPTPVATPTPTPTPVPSSTALELKVLDTSVPANGIFQFQLSTTEPKPIGHGSTRPQVPSGPVRGVAVNDPSGQAVGIAVVNGSDIAIQLSTPNGSVPLFGTDVNYPIVTMSMDLSQSLTPMNPGDHFPIAIAANPVFFPDSSNQSYPTITTAAGVLTIAPAGSPAVSDVIPGGGLLADRTPIRILGSGFDANTRVSIEDTTIFQSDTHLISPTEIDVVICNGASETATTCPNTGATLRLDGERVRVKDQNNNVNEYYTYQRADDIAGTPSNTALISLVHPMFSQQTYTNTTIPLVNNATQFTGVSIQNTSGSPLTIAISLVNDSNVNLGTVQVTLPNRQKITRDVIADFFSGTVPAGATKIKISSPQNVQVLGMLGDNSAGTVVPVVPQ